MQVTRRRRPKGPVGLTGFPAPNSRHVKMVVAGTTGLAVAGAGAAYASTVPFGHNQVGTTYRNGEQVSSDQVINPIGTRLVTPYGKFMGSSVSSDGRFLAATSTDKSVALQIFDLSTYKLI